ncbi:hypothetical protein BDV59DRAFT_185941 [Aspergillus ambiguus]|uniref:uncharacterized protein n=1 Tax=Aspergillus ambiguus TaxID=176160 RepID=UPI003CCC9919
MYGALTKEMHSSGLSLPRPEAPFLGLSYIRLVKRVLSFRSPQWYSSGYYERHRCINSSLEALFGPLCGGIGGLALSNYIP